MTDILGLYRSTGSINAVAKRLGKSRATVRSHLLAHGMKPNPASPGRLTDGDRSEIIELLRRGQSCCALGRIFGVSARCVGEIARRNNISIDHRLKLIDGKFDELDADNAYWIGLLVADGHLVKGRYRINLTLKDDDSYLLDELSSYLGLDGRGVHDIKGKKAKVLSFSSRRIYSRLTDLGFLELKNRESTKILDNISPQLFGHFLRGWSDGDGSVLSNKWQLVCNYKDALDRLCSILHTSIGLDLSVSRSRSMTKRGGRYVPTGNFLYRVIAYSHRKRSAVYGLMYGTPYRFCMRRKSPSHPHEVSSVETCLTSSDIPFRLR